VDFTVLIDAIRAYCRVVKTTRYFDLIRSRPDRVMITDEWIRRAIDNPLQEQQQADGRVRRWASIPEMGGRVLRVILLSDRETVHNAFFDRRFVP
jgi:hypothetical protein